MPANVLYGQREYNGKWCVTLTYSIYILGSFRLVLPHFVFRILKALSHIVNRLVLCDWVFLEGGLVGVEGQDFGLVCQAVLKENRV